jgi:hypothetical protein
VHLWESKKACDWVFHDWGNRGTHRDDLCSQLANGIDAILITSLVVKHIVNFV